MEAIKSQTKANNSDLDKIKLRNKGRQETAGKGQAAAMSKLEGTQAKTAVKTKKLRESDLSAMETRNTEKMKAIVTGYEKKKRAAAKDLTEYMRELVRDFAADTKELKRLEDAYHKSEQAQKKIDIKALPKKEQTAAKKSNKTEAEDHVKQLAQRHEQRTLRFKLEQKYFETLEYDKRAWENANETTAEIHRAHKEGASIRSSYQEKEYQQSIQFENEHHQSTLFWYETSHPTDVADLKAEQESEAASLQKMHELEKVQQAEVHALREKTKNDLFKKEKVVEQKKLNTSIKQYEKENKKKLTKGDLASYKAKTQADWEKLMAEKKSRLEKMLKEDADEDVDMLGMNHQQNIAQQQADFDVSLQGLMRTQKDAVDACNKAHNEKLAALEAAHWEALVASMKSENQQSREYLAQHVRDFETDLYKQTEAKHKQLHESFVVEFEALVKEQHLPPEQLSYITATLQAAATILCDTELQRWTCLQVLQKEELELMTAQHAEEEKKIILAAPPGVLSELKANYGISEAPIQRATSTLLASSQGDKAQKRSTNTRSNTDSQAARKPKK